MRTLILPVLLTVIISGCNNSAGNKSSETSLDNAKFPANQTLIIPSGNNAPVNNVIIPSGDTGKPVSVPVITAAKGLNPAHGQPGHRCDIAVGAPLDSKPTTPVVAMTPASTTVETKPVTPVAPVTTSISTTNTVAPGMNPEHGKPGHRCDIAVGAPLNSQPTSQPAIITQPVQQQENVATKSQLVKPTTTSEVAPVVPTTALNPEHGKPGHRCDIAVGAPLNSTPTNTPPKKD
ncbi:MAG: hypothetical protein HZB42_14115 [Sphingobacteriales bacterium]|nr:hypothetical protein [Sphingobacteriales bacterium]